MVCGQGGISGLLRLCRTFVRLGLQGQYYGSSVSNFFNIHALNSEREQESISLNCGFKFVSYEARNRFDRIDSEFQREEYRSASPSTQEHQNWRVN